MICSVLFQMRLTRVEVQTFEFFEKINAVSGPEEAYALLGQEFGQFGFSNFLITDMPPATSGLENHLILNGWSPQWFERYMGENFYRDDPMAKRTRETTRSFFWDEVESTTEPTPRSLQIMNEASDFGLRRGFSVPIVGASGDQSCVTMGGELLEIPPRGREALEMMSIYALYRARGLRKMSVQLAKSGPALTPREREILKWVALGKTDWEIGEILRISSETSTAHVRNSCRKLNATTRAQAVALALQRGDIVL